MPTLQVRLLSGSNLEAKDIGGTSDPYCELKVGSCAQRSKTIKRTLNPCWNDTFTFPVENPFCDKLLISVFDYDRFSRNDPMGFAVVPLQNLVRGHPTVETVSLQNARCGTLTLELTACDFGMQTMSQHVPYPSAMPYGNQPYPQQQLYPQQLPYPPQQYSQVSQGYHSGYGQQTPYSQPQIPSNQPTYGQRYQHH